MHEEVPNFWYSSKKCPLHEIIYLRILWKYQLPMQLSKIKEFSLSLCNNTENHDYMDHTESLLNMLYKGGGGGGGKNKKKYGIIN